MTHRIALAVLSLVPVLAGCAAFGNSEPAPEWKELEVQAPSEAVLFKLTLLAVESQGYPVAGGTDRGEGKVITGWKTSLAPFGGEGYRLRAELFLEPSSPSHWKVRAHVQKQTNEALAAPLDPTRAEWKWAPDDPGRAQVLLQHLRSALEPTSAAPAETPARPR